MHHSLLFSCHFQIGFSSWYSHNCLHHFHMLDWMHILPKLRSLHLKILLHGLRKHKTDITLLRVTCYNQILANDMSQRDHLWITVPVVCYMLPDSYLSGNTSLWCFHCAWHHVQSVAHMYMWSLYLTFQVGIVTRWCSACTQCSFHWNWRLLKRNKRSLKGSGCQKIPGLWKS